MRFQALDIFRAPRPARAAGGLLRDRSGATAVEFALVALPLIFMLGSVLELAMVFLISSTLENATNDTARTIRTGQVQGGAAANNNAAAVRDVICSKLGWLQSQCSTNLSIDVRTYKTFSTPNAPSPITNGTFDSTKLAYSIGAQGDVVLVRAFYRWTLLTPFLKGGLSNLNNGVTMITATAMFKNEPY